MAPSIENNTHIVVLIDRSGSMATIASDVIGGFNTDNTSWHWMF